MHNLSKNAAAGLGTMKDRNLPDVKAHAFRPALHPEHDHNRWCNSSWEDHGPHTEAPSPSRVEQHMLSKVSPGVERGDGRDRLGKSEDDSTID